MVLNKSAVSGCELSELKTVIRLNGFFYLFEGELIE